MSWPTPISTSYMNCCSIWSSRTCRSKAAGTPRHKTTTVYPRGVSARSQCRMCCRSRRSGTRMNHCNEDLQIKLYTLKGILCDSLGHNTASMPRLLFICSFYWYVCYIVFGFYVLLLNFSLWGRLQGQRADAKGWNWDAWCEMHTESLKVSEATTTNEYLHNGILFSY